MGDDPAAPAIPIFGAMYAPKVMVASGRAERQPLPGKTPGQAEGDRETADENVREMHRKAGITDLPADAERPPPAPSGRR